MRDLRNLIWQNPITWIRKLLPFLQGIIDISVGLSSKTVAMDSETGLGDFRYLMNAIDDGDFFNGSGLRDLSAHAGTHVDSPGHFINVRIIPDCLSLNTNEDYIKSLYVLKAASWRSPYV